MYNQKDIQFNGRHDYDQRSAEHYAGWGGGFSIGIFKWELANNGKRLKRGKVVIRLKAKSDQLTEALLAAENIVNNLDSGYKYFQKNIIL